MKIGIFAREGDPIAERLRERLEARAAQARVLEFGKLSRGVPFAYDGEEWLFEGVALSDFDAFFVRQIPAETALLDKPGAISPTEVWWERSQLAKERAHIAQSCLADLEMAGKRLVNPTASAVMDQKPLQLATFSRSGVRIPRTLITNFPSAVRTFAEDVGELIYKPVGGGAETQVFGEEAQAKLEQIVTSPVIFQERLVGPDIRVTIVGDQVVSSVEIPTEQVDYRASPTYRAGAQEYRAHPLPDDVARLCLRAARLCHQELSGVDLKLTSNGYVLIEANSCPVYLDIELKTGAGITDALADLLLRSA
jgi:glutathione synthase/RimK-type ligase-like ATP-grasp enzyme